MITNGVIKNKEKDPIITGIWLRREFLQGGILDTQFACSNCDYTSGHVMTSWKYCPVCGARLFLTIEQKNKWLEKE